MLFFLSIQKRKNNGWEAIRKKRATSICLIKLKTADGIVNAECRAKTSFVKVPHHLFIIFCANFIYQTKFPLLQLAAACGGPRRILFFFVSDNASNERNAKNRPITRTRTIVRWRVSLAIKINKLYLGEWRKTPIAGRKQFNGLCLARRLNRIDRSI